MDLSKVVDLQEDEIPMLVDRNYIRMRVESSTGTVIEAAKRELLSFGAAAVMVQAMPKPAIREGVAEISHSHSESLEESLTGYVAKVEGVDRKALLKEVQEIFHQAHYEAII